MHRIKDKFWRIAVNYLAASEIMPYRLRPTVLRRLGAHIGGEVEIRAGVKISSSKLLIGHGSYINRDVYINNFATVDIGHNVALAPGAMVTTVSHEATDPNRRQGRTTFNPVVIEDGVWIGARAMVLPGVTIGKGCVIAAGAVVIRDCEPNGLYAGSPASAASCNVCLVHDLA